ncbi:MAG: hypothetical protein OEZ06_06405 [Myxococcales bacterium]|nr:hypothetical protein [Myxococcales bacterium]
MDRRQTHHVYLIPGLFGFAELAGYDYFGHVERGLQARFARAGLSLRPRVIAAPPTASIALRTAVIARQIARDAERSSGPIHLLGHSTGGLDARLLISPGCNVDVGAAELAWTRRVASLATIDCPHYGTPLAGYFTTVAGTRMLYALSLLTVTSLTLGRIPLTAFSGMVAAVEALDDALGLDIHLIDQLTDTLLRFVGERGRGEIHDYLAHVHGDRGGIIQLMPEVMELFNAAVHDNPDVRYGCIAAASPPPGPRRLLRAVTSPLAALQLAVYTTVYGVTSRADARYPYAKPDAEQARLLSLGLGREVEPEMVDGIVPTLSMLWRELLWCGQADHLDLVGHFADGARPRVHVDWLDSGARFNRREFGTMLDALTSFMMRGFLVAGD